MAAKAFIVFTLAMASASPTFSAEPLLRVGVIAARAQPFSPDISLTGDIEAQVESDISFRVSGRIVERLAEVGDHISPDQVLARLDGQEQKIDLDTANAALVSAQAQLDQAQITFRRQKTLIATQATSQSSLDDAQEALSVAQGAVDAANAQKAQALEQLGYAELRAGVAGTVTARSAEVGEVVQPGQSVVQVAQDGPRDAVFDVYEALLNKPPGSRRVRISLISDPGVTATGTVREISPIVDAKKGTIRVKIGLDSTPPAMTLGAPVRGEGSLAPEPRMVLPATALFEWQDKPAVWIVAGDSHIAQPRTVTVDRYTTSSIVLAEGVSEGDLVVTKGIQLLKPGQKVEPVEEQAP